MYERYCFHIWAGGPKCYLELLDKLQKWICRTVGPQNLATLSHYYLRYYFGRCSSEVAQLVPLPFSQRSSAYYSEGCVIFLSPFLDVTRMSQGSN